MIDERILESCCAHITAPEGSLCTDFSCCASEDVVYRWHLGSGEHKFFSVPCVGKSCAFGPVYVRRCVDGHIGFGELCYPNLVIIWKFLRMIGSFVEKIAQR